MAASQEAAQFVKFGDELIREVQSWCQVAKDEVVTPRPFLFSWQTYKPGTLMLDGRTLDQNGRNPASHPTPSFTTTTKSSHHTDSAAAAADTAVSGATTLHAALEGGKSSTFWSLDGSQAVSSGAAQPLTSAGNAPSSGEGATGAAEPSSQQRRRSSVDVATSIDYTASNIDYDALLAQALQHASQPQRRTTAQQQLQEEAPKIADSIENMKDAGRVTNHPAVVADRRRSTGSNGGAPTVSGTSGGGSTKSAAGAASSLRDDDFAQSPARMPSATTTTTNNNRAPSITTTVPLPVSTFMRPAHSGYTSSFGTPAPSSGFGGAAAASQQQDDSMPPRSSPAAMSPAAASKAAAAAAAAASAPRNAEIVYDALDGRRYSRHDAEDDDDDNAAVSRRRSSRQQRQNGGGGGPFGLAIAVAKGVVTVAAVMLTTAATTALVASTAMALNSGMDTLEQQGDVVRRRPSFGALMAAALPFGRRGRRNTGDAASAADPFMVKTAAAAKAKPVLRPDASVGRG